MKRKMTIVAAALLVVVATASTYAWARTKADATISACVAKDGNVRIVAAGTICKNGESPLEWSQQGPAGTAGTAGTVGTAGAAGTQGVAGRDGRDGVQGSQGVQGPQGPAGASAAGASDAVTVSMTATGQKQGAFTGDGASGTIDVIAFNHEIVSPRDPASGLASGKRQHKPITITKELDRSTPLFLNSLVTNETLTTVQFNFKRGGTTYLTVKLTNASVSDWKQTGENESLSFTYQKIEWTWVNGGITASDDWQAIAS